MGPPLPRHPNPPGLPIYTEICQTMSRSALNPFLRQRDFNRASQANWRPFAAHREQVTSRLLAPAAGATGALCVLGAGNCNDLDLLRLTAHWPAIRLVDIDAQAMQAGVAHQFSTTAGADRIRRIEFSACDLTGALELCHEFAQAPSRERFARLRTALTLLPAPGQLGSRFPAVASTCLLSQLIRTFEHAAGQGTPEAHAFTELVRLQHLRTVAELTAPGGTALLFTDFVSSESCPELLDTPPPALPAVMHRVVAAHGCFSGMNPLAIHRLLASPPLASYWAEPPALSLPWVWDLGPRRYLVTAIACRRKLLDDRSPLAP
jgi:hypothetical protein